jgi:peptide deformylase
MLDIAQLGQPVLREVATAVAPEMIATVEFQGFLREMLVTLEESRGVGLAAPQVFAGIRVFLAVVAPQRDADGPRPVEVFINPRLTFLSEDRASAWEGCLSFMELLVLVPRYQAVRVDYLDAQGQPRSRELQGFAARVVQHEYDHLDGILTIDRAASTRDIIKASEVESLFGEDEDECEDEGAE